MRVFHSLLPLWTLIIRWALQLKRIELSWEDSAASYAASEEEEDSPGEKKEQAKDLKACKFQQAG